MVSKHGLGVEDLRHESPMLAKAISVRRVSNSFKVEPDRAQPLWPLGLAARSDSQIVVEHGFGPRRVVRTPLIQEVSYGIYRVEHDDGSPKERSVYNVS